MPSENKGSDNILNNLWEEIVIRPNIIPYNRVETELEMPKLKL